MASQYLGLLLRMDPQLHGFKVVAWHEPLLQCKVTDQKGDIKMALVSAPHHRAAQRRDGVGAQSEEASGYCPSESSATRCQDPVPEKHPLVP